MKDNEPMALESSAMVVSKHEAAQALQDIDAAQQRTQSMLCYRAAAPHFLMWGGIWLVANCITAFDIALGGTAWRILVIVGSIVSIWLSARRVKQRVTFQRRWQIGAAWCAILVFFVSSFAVLPSLNGRQTNAYISLFWAFIYVLMGIWSGWRILVVGVLTTASILVGYFLITTHYLLWMGLVTGSLLMLGGLWLRKV